MPPFSEVLKMKKPYNLLGQRFERLTVTLLSPSRDNSGCVMWECKCDCGSIVHVRAGKLRSGQTRSCGCLSKDNHTTHGMRHTPEYEAWRNMLKRCYLRSYVQYADYGGRGITVCDDWQESFENFYRDMGPRPSDEHSLERKNNSEGYSKDNCRWATKEEQANNRRSNVVYEYDGEKKTLTQWCSELKLNYDSMRYRLSKGMSFEDAADDLIKSTR